MRWRGLEPPRPYGPQGPQPCASTNSATSAWGTAIVAAPRSCGDSRARTVNVGPVRDLCALAVDAALGAGASYADARAVVRRSQRVATKNGRVETVNDVESEGIGVRVLVGGAWGSAGWIAVQVVFVGLFLMAFSFSSSSTTDP